MYMYAMRQNSVLKGMGARFKFYMLFFPVSYLGLSALLPVFDTKLCAIAHRRHVHRIHARNCRPCLAQNRRGGGGGGGGGGGRYLTEKREGEEPLSLTFIGRLMPLEIVVNRAIVYCLNTIPLCYK